jgi:hypothetical protein
MCRGVSHTRLAGSAPTDFDPIPNLYLGASSWSAESWVGPFYPHGTPPADFLLICATHYQTLEIDSTDYGMPSRTTKLYDRTNNELTLNEVEKVRT